jgi:DNA-binding NarL/FixJ family response regulator
MRQGGTLMISRAVKLFPQIQRRLEELGFPKVDVTGEEKDSLNMVINEKKPDLVLVGSGFYQACTPLMMGQLLKRFRKLKIAAVSVHEYPDSVAAWFIFHGVNSYVNLWEGVEEFHRGLRIVREGKDYIAPQVKELIDMFPEWPQTDNEASRRLKEILVLLCRGFSADSIGAELQLSRKTVYNHMDRLYSVFNVKNRDAMVARAWELHLVTDKDMCFFDRRNEKEPLPDWAAAQINMNRRLAIKSASMRIL